MESNNNGFLLPKRYNHTLMERQNKREREILERRNIDIEFSNRPRSYGQDIFNNRKRPFSTFDS